MQNIVNNNRPRKSHSPKRDTQSYLCLNPLCINPPRFFNDQTIHKINSNRPHGTCQGYCFNFNDLKTSLSPKTQIHPQQHFDFLLDPINSISNLAKCSQNKWLDQIRNIFLMIQKEITDYLSQILCKKYEQISQDIIHIVKTSQHVQELVKNISKSNSSQPHNDYYQQNLSSQLRQISNRGKLNVLNYEMVSSQIDNVKKQIDKVIFGIWDYEPESVKISRKQVVKYKDQTRSINFDLTKEQVNLRLQKIQSQLKVKRNPFGQQGDTMSIQCGYCSQIIESYLPIKHERKSQCLSLLLKHYYQYHQAEVVEKVVKKSKEPSYRISYQHFLKQIKMNRYKEYVLVDRQNIKTSNFVTIKSPDIYVVEVVSKPCEHLAIGRYLVAQLKKKDAADTLMILMTKDMTQILGKAKITLITRDHFGQNLKHLLASTIDFHINVAHQFSDQDKIKQQSTYMIIE